MNILSGLHIDKSIISNYVEPVVENISEDKVINEVEKENEKEESNERYEQISIFDEIFDDED